MRKEEVQKLPSAAKMVRAQLTLRAVVWDAAKIPAAETEKLDQEWGKFFVLKLDIRMGQQNKGCQAKYEWMRNRLKTAGILESDALLVTDDAELSAYVYGRRQYPNDQAETGTKHPVGMAVVFYERECSGNYADADMVVQGFEEVGIQFLDRVHKRKNHLPWNILYTKRTCVREITLADLDALFAVYRGEGITDYTEPLMERDREEAYIKSYIDCMYYYYGYGMWVVCDRNTGRLIGRAGIEHRDGEDGSVRMELGYIIAREYQNQGYAQEVCRAILEYAAQALELEEIHCFIHPQNAASVRVAKKLGFSLCGMDECGQDGLLHFHMELAKVRQEAAGQRLS